MVYYAIIIFDMIESFQHKGLKAFFNTGIKSGINPDHAEKIDFILATLRTSRSPQDMGLPMFDLHELKGDRKGTWAVSVSGNWRVTFKFEDENAINVNYEDYH